MLEPARTDHARHDMCISACQEKAKLGIDHGWCDVCATARAEALAAEVEPLREKLRVSQLKLQAWVDAEDKILDALGPRDRDILHRIRQLRAAEAARDHLRARLRDLKRELLRADQRQESVSPPTLKEWAADLLAILEAPSEPPKEQEKVKDDQSRMDTRT